jgi:transcriptional regulator with XRE-family HTH domain
MGNMATDPTLGTSIARARGRKHWTQQQLANAIGVDRKTIDNWENGRTIPHRHRIGALEEALGPLGGEAPHRDPRAEMLEAVARLRAEADRIERAATPGGGDGSSAGDGQAS